MLYSVGQRPKVPLSGEKFVVPLPLHQMLNLSSDTDTDVIQFFHTDLGKDPNTLLVQKTPTST